MQISYNLGGILGIDFVTVDYDNGTIFGGVCGKVSKKCLKDGLLAHDFQIVKCNDNDVIIDIYTAYFCKYSESNNLETFLDGLTSLLRSFLQASDHRKVFYKPYSNSEGVLYYISNIALFKRTYNDDLGRKIFNEAKQGFTDAFIFVGVDSIEAFEKALYNSGFDYTSKFDYIRLMDMEGYLDSDVLCFCTAYAVMQRSNSLDYVAMKHDDFSFTGKLKQLCEDIKANVIMRDIFSLLSTGFFDEDKDDPITADMVVCLGLSKYYTIEGDYLYIYATDYKSIPEDAIKYLRDYLLLLQTEFGECGLSIYRDKLFDCLVFNMDDLRLFNTTLEKFVPTIRKSRDEIYVSVRIYLASTDFIAKRLSGYWNTVIKHKWETLEKIFKSFSPVVQYEFDGNYADNFDTAEYEEGFVYDDGIFNFSYRVVIASEENVGFALSLLALVFNKLLPYLHPYSDDDFVDGFSHLWCDFSWLADFSGFIGKRFSPAIQRRVLFGESDIDILKSLGFKFNDEDDVFSPYNGLLERPYNKHTLDDMSCIVLDEILSGRTNCKITDINLRSFVKYAEKPNCVKGMILANMYKENPKELYKIAQDTTGDLEVDFDEAERVLGGYLVNG